MVARIPVFDVRPHVESGRFPVKVVQSRPWQVWARLTAERHLKIRASVVFTAPEGATVVRLPMHHVDNDHWSATVVLDQLGTWSFAIETWHDPIAAWLRDTTVRLEAEVDTEIHFAVGARVISDARSIDPSAMSVALDLVNPDIAAIDRLATAIAFAESLPGDGVRHHLGISDSYPVQVDRHRAEFGAWYEFFPRSEGAYRRSDGTLVGGTLLTAAQRLEAIAAMGFDVVYLPPIHPIGLSRRKGRNNALAAAPGDPGSPWAIGSDDGGHDAVNPQLGTLDDFDLFVDRARGLGLEVALDLALQCSPDHPWLREHPEWFVQRPDGTIATAENPPKTYEDIHPLNFDDDPDGLRREIERIVRHWMAHGVRIFRVDNPHTKPIDFWQHLLNDIRATDPDVVFLAEAFTVPAMVHMLAMAGFHQNYTYFTWREHSAEIIDYLDEVNHRTSSFMRPNFFVNTPDILPRHLQGAGPEMFRVRAALAALGSPTWGMYAGFELCENTPLGSGSEEYLDSEKYEVKIRDWDDAGSIAPFITVLNEIRRRHPALQKLGGMAFHAVGASDVIAFSRRDDDDIVLVVITLEPTTARRVPIGLDADALGLDPHAVTLWRDEITSQTMTLASIDLSSEHPVRVLTVDRGESDQISPTT